MLTGSRANQRTGCKQLPQHYRMLMQGLSAYNTSFFSKLKRFLQDDLLFNSPFYNQTVAQGMFILDLFSLGKIALSPFESVVNTLVWS